MFASPFPYTEQCTEDTAIDEPCAQTDDIAPLGEDQVGHAGCNDTSTIAAQGAQAPQDVKQSGGPLREEGPAICNPNSPEKVDIAKSTLSGRSDSTGGMGRRETTSVRRRLLHTEDDRSVNSAEATGDRRSNTGPSKDTRINKDDFETGAGSDATLMRSQSSAFPEPRDDLHAMDAV